jgi:hypothetical protein
MNDHPCPVWQRARARITDTHPGARLRRTGDLWAVYLWAAKGVLFGGRAGST